MEVAAFLVNLLTSQAAEAATVTLSLGDAVGGAVGGGIPLSAFLGWLGYKKYRKNNQDQDPHKQKIESYLQSSCETQKEMLSEIRKFNVNQQLMAKDVQEVVEYTRPVRRDG